MTTATETEPVLTPSYWARRQTACDRLTELAAGYFAADAGESAAWIITHWGRTIVKDADVRDCREFLRCKATSERLRRFHDLLTAEHLVGSSSSHGPVIDFTPCG